MTTILSSGCALAGQVPQKMREPRAGQQLDYWLHMPDSDPPEGGWPVVLFLHGSGERGSDLAKVKVHGPPKLVEEIPELGRAVVISPQCPSERWWIPETLKALLDEVLEAQGKKVDRSRIYCTGLSMGGYGTWNMVANYPTLFAAAAPICGGGDPSRLKVEVVRKGVPEFDEARLRQATDLPVWVFHGAADPVVLQAESEMLIDVLRAGGNKKVKFTSYPGVGHDSWTRTYEDPKFYRWLFAQRRAGG